MRLIHEPTDQEVTVGMSVRVDDEPYVVTAIQKPHEPSSTGRVYVKRPNESDNAAISYFPSVIGAKWIEREDHGWTPESDRPRGDAGVATPRPEDDGTRLFELTAEYDTLQAEIDELRQRMAEVSAERDKIIRKLFHEPLPVRRTS